MASALLTVVALLWALAVAAGQDDNNAVVLPGWPSCSTTDNYTDGSQYKKNLDQLLAALPAAAGDNGWFYKGSAGAGGADEVFGLIMCYADWNAIQCQYCLADAGAGIKHWCPGSRSASAIYNACVLRYSDEPIPATADLEVVFNAYVSGEPVTSQGLSDAWLRLMTKLTSGVTADPLRLANDTAPYSSSQEMYGLAQCTRDLNGTECSKCINSYIGQLGDMFPNDTGGAIKGHSCYLIYQVGKLDITLPPAPRNNVDVVRSTEPSSSSKTGIVIVVYVGSVLIILGLAMWFLLRRRKSKKQAKIFEQGREHEMKKGGDFDDDDEPEMENEFEKGTGPKRFGYSELAIAADNFSDTHKLGEEDF
nr:unnamed protein product [Digitaria exilis]